MTVDPVDGCTFWYTNMYFPVQGANWVTRIGSFKFPTCADDTTTLLASAPNPSVFGQPVTLIATVGSTVTGMGTPSGQVSFTIGAGLPVTASLNNGVATLITGTLPVGTYPITATYSGDLNFNGSQAVLGTDQTVDKAATATALAFSPLPPLGSPTLTITATVTVLPPGAGTPTGVLDLHPRWRRRGDAGSLVHRRCHADHLIACARLSSPGCSLQRQSGLQPQRCEHPAAPPVRAVPAVGVALIRSQPARRLAASASVPPLPPPGLVRAYSPPSIPLSLPGRGPG